MTDTYAEKQFVFRSLVSATVADADPESELRRNIEEHLRYGIETAARLQMLQLTGPITIEYETPDNGGMLMPGELKEAQQKRLGKGIRVSLVTAPYKRRNQG